MEKYFAPEKALNRKIGSELIGLTKHLTQRDKQWML
jgi:hypothetical protein